MNIKRRVSNLIKKYGTSDPIQLCKYLKIDISYEDLGEIKGYYRMCLRKKMIIINSEINSFSKKIVLSHELGHAVLHGKDIIFMKSYFTSHRSTLYENQANEFAKYLLEDSQIFDEIESPVDYKIIESIFR